VLDTKGYKSCARSACGSGLHR